MSAAEIQPWIDTPEAVEADLIEEIHSAISNHPRSKQRWIGPSEIGTACPRALLHKLNGDEEPPRAYVPWLPTVGTAVHAWLADVMSHAIGQTLPEPRYLIEQRVNVGQLNGLDVSGSADLFDRLTGTVVDWKILGVTSTREYRRHGMKQQYRAQAHLYGRGFARLGYTVNQVMVMCLPRNEMSLGARYCWTEPYDEQVAIDALARAEGLHRLLAAIGIEAALMAYAPCKDTRSCSWCNPPTATRPSATPGADPFARSVAAARKALL